MFEFIIVFIKFVGEVCRIGLFVVCCFLFSCFECLFVYDLCYRVVRCLFLCVLFCWWC